MADVRFTHIGGPTTLIEVAGLRLLTDPTFDAPGRRYSFGWGSASRKTTGPALAAADLPPIDAVLLTHDQHGDNLDAAGRALLPAAGVVLTTPSAAGRLGGNAVGLAAWQTATVGSGDQRIVVTATPPVPAAPPQDGGAGALRGLGTLPRGPGSRRAGVRGGARRCPLGAALATHRHPGDAPRPRLTGYQGRTPQARAIRLEAQIR
ncbi:hypothetical protein AB0C04_06170 [Micromonospora sp. NPDC048909]|uniref:MBL fold metallo-hydrolase n=1 Tax=Micromonospora sp. NPDC048909 TaxID=3155643 RepID=UPI0034102F0C